MTRPIVANGAVIDFGIDGLIDTFVRPDGIVAGPAQRQSGGIQWYDAAETHPTQFDPFEVIDGNLCAPPTVRSVHYDDPENPDIYPIDPDTGEEYSPWIVTHRLVWADLGVSDNFELNLAWEILTDVHAFAQVSLVFGVDLDADPFENGCLYAYDISRFGGASYWHNVPMTPDIASCFDPTYYTNLGGSVSMPIAGVGRHWWRVRCQDGSMVAAFDGRNRHAPIARPAWTVGRTTVGVHVVSMSCPPDPNFVGDAAFWLPVVSDPPAVATVSTWSAREIL